ncbi:DUF4062 domain-containing protein [Marinobacter sp. LN3S78]
MSSTCFDLAEVRDSLVGFCHGFGFEVVLSEQGDVFYHPDLHTHESCVNEVSNCQLLILIIGGRFGGSYRIDPSKSITNAEYSAAKEVGLPVFTFVKEGVLADHHVYQKNKSKPFSSEIEYPSIDKQEFAENIFNFIDAVRGADVNNGFFDFKYAKDIHESLRKQWAGMFFEYLSQRSISNQLSSTNESIRNLSIASRKIEELVKSVYRQVDEVGANDSISIIDLESEASKFFAELASKIDNKGFIPFKKIESLSANPPNEWWNFILQISDDFELIPDVMIDEDRSTSVILNQSSGIVVCDIEGKMTPGQKKLKERLESGYKAFLNLSVDSRKNVISKYDDLPF